MTESEISDNLAVHVAWLSYVGGHTQASIAKRFGLSRAKVHRLIGQAHDSGCVHVFIDRSPQKLVEMGDVICRQHQLSSCIVVPSVDAADPESSMDHGSVAALGAAAARQLDNRLDQGDVRTLGVSWGRSLAEMGRRLPRRRRNNLSVVSVMGILTRTLVVNPFDVVHRITEATAARGYFIPVPFISDSVDDHEILFRQRSVRDAMDSARDAQLCYVGIGSMTMDQPMFREENGLLGPATMQRLRDAGAQGELVGHFLGSDGQELDIDLNKQTIGLTINELRQRETIGVAGGRDKARAIRAALASKTLTGLIIDENAAVCLCEPGEQAA